MVKQPKVHYKPPGVEYHKIISRQYCGIYLFGWRTTGDVNQVTCKRCKGMLAAEMFKYNSKDEWEKRK